MATIKAALLDTHTFLWTIFEPERLSRAVTKLLKNPEISLHLSAASIWEIAVKHGKGKLYAPESLIDVNVIELGLVPLSISSHHVRRISYLPQLPKHKDPFDRMLAAQSIVEHLPLITADKAFCEYEGIKVIW